MKSTTQLDDGQAGGSSVDQQRLVHLCPKCGGTEDVAIVKNGNKSDVGAGGSLTPREYGTFVRCMNDSNGVCYCGKWISRTDDAESDKRNAIQAWNNEVNAKFTR